MQLAGEIKSEQENWEILRWTFSDYSELQLPSELSGGEELTINVNISWPKLIPSVTII